MLGTALIIALVVLFLHVSTWEGMVNGWVQDVTFNWPGWIKKPLFDCPICMAPWHGVWIYTVLLYADMVPYMSIPAFILTTFMAGGINTVLIYIISYAKDKPGTECACAE